MSGSKPIYFWDRDSTMTLITLYKKHPCLYMVTHINFYDKDARHKAFKKITSDYNTKKHTALTMTEIQEKIRNLRTQYFADVSKFKECRILGVSEDPVYDNLTWCYDYLDFLSQPCEVVNDLIDHLESLPTDHPPSLSQPHGQGVKRRIKQDLSENTNNSKHIGFSRFVTEELETIGDEDVVDHLKEAITELIFSYKKKSRNKKK